MWDSLILICSICCAVSVVLRTGTSTLNMTEHNITWLCIILRESFHYAPRLLMPGSDGFVGEYSECSYVCNLEMRENIYPVQFNLNHSLS